MKQEKLEKHCNTNQECEQCLPKTYYYRDLPNKDNNRTTKQQLYHWHKIATVAIVYSTFLTTVFIIFAILLIIAKI